MKLLAGRTQDLADVEAMVASGIDRAALMKAVETGIPERRDTLERLFENVDRVSLILTNPQSAQMPSSTVLHSDSARER